MESLGARAPALVAPGEALRVKRRREGRGCDLWECEELGGKDAGACATGHGCGSSRSAREREPDRIVGGKMSTGALGAAAGAGVLAPSEERGRRCELLKVG